MTNYRYALKETLPPATEPLTLAEMRTYLKLDHENDDGLIGGFIRAARELCEKETGLSLINRSYSLFMDSWDDDRLYLPSCPVASVQAINIYDNAGNASVFPSFNYSVDCINLYNPRIMLETSFPIPGRNFNGIEVQYVAGFGESAQDVPEVLRQAMRQIVTYLYENRGDSAGNALKNSGANALFCSFRKMRVQ